MRNAASKTMQFIMEENKSVLEPENFEYCDDNKVIFNQFSCPKCDSLLFFDEFEAREFIDKV